MFKFKRRCECAEEILVELRRIADAIERRGKHAEYVAGGVIKGASATVKRAREDEKGTLVADDAGVARVAAAVAEQRKGLMDRLGS